MLGYKFKSFTVKYSLEMEQLVPIISVQPHRKKQCKNSIIPTRKSWTTWFWYIFIAIKFQKSISWTWFCSCQHFNKWKNGTKDSVSARNKYQLQLDLPNSAIHRVGKGVILWELLPQYENRVGVIKWETMAINNSHIMSSYINFQPYIDLW